MKDEIMAALERMRQQRIKVSPCHTNRASEMGHPCLRYLVYCRSRWQDRKAIDARLQAIFDMGVSIEALVKRDLEDARVEVTESQVALFDARYQLSGHLDCKVAFNGSPNVPLEIKGIQPFDWEKLNALSDFFVSKKPWIRKYPGQILLYMLLTNSERGILLLKNKLSAEEKIIVIEGLTDESLDYAEELLQKCEAVNKHVAEHTVPERMASLEFCDRCDFAHLCCPDEAFGPLEVMLDEEFEAILDARAGLEASAKLFDELDGDAKEKVKRILDAKKFTEGRTRLQCGAWTILVSRSAKATRIQFVKESTDGPKGEVADL